MQLQRGFADYATLLFLMACLLCEAHSQTESARSTVNFRGRYIPELYRADRGRYIPDDSGKYRHVFVPYNGGYGDRGLQYEHDDNAKYKRPPEPFALGPRDHLRFMVDFNYNGTGWQIIEFDWVRDGDETKQYNYANQNQLWQRSQYSAGGSAGQQSFGPYDYGGSFGETGGQDGFASGNEQIDDGYANVEAAADPQSQSPEDSSNNVHLDGEYENSQFTYNYTNDDVPVSEQQGQEQAQVQGTAATEHSAKDLRDAITEILDYIKTNIIPNLP